MNAIKYVFGMILIAIASVTVLAEDAVPVIWQIGFVGSLMALPWLWESKEDKALRRYAKRTGKYVILASGFYEPRKKP